MGKYREYELWRRKQVLESEIPQCENRERRERLQLEYIQVKRELKELQKKRKERET